MSINNSLIMLLKMSESRSMYMNNFLNHCNDSLEPRDLYKSNPLIEASLCYPVGLESYGNDEIDYSITGYMEDDLGIPNELQMAYNYFHNNYDILSPERYVVRHNIPSYYIPRATINQYKYMIEKYNKSMKRR